MKNYIYVYMYMNVCMNVYIDNVCVLPKINK